MLAVSLKWLLNGVVFLILILYSPGLHMARWPSVLWAALVWGFVNSLIGPLFLVFNSSPFLLFLGIITLIINFTMLALTVRLVPGFSIRRLSGALTGTTLFSLISFLLTQFIHS